jgi:SAM-dependent MidA family methyltransferase
MTPLAILLRDEITDRGAMSFHDFMTAALYHPEHGYYASGRARIGRRGDFFTNVSVGSLFGRLLARQFAEMWERLGSPARWTIVEEGAHAGQFAADALEGLREFAPACFEATCYVIVEPLPIWRNAQMSALYDLQVQWCASLAELEPFTGIHFSNELLDAFPVHLVARTGGGWVERHVILNGESFVFSDGPLTDLRLANHLATIDAPPGFATEVNLRALDWLSELFGKLDRGYVLLIDYGYSREEYFERFAGTLSAYAGHQREPDPLARPGEIDLTAHVEFSTLIEHARRAGFRVHGFTDQQRFMVGVSRPHFSDSIVSADELRAFKTLMHPDFLGAAFKVLCLEKGDVGPAPLSGFQYSHKAKLEE